MSTAVAITAIFVILSKAEWWYTKRMTNPENDVKSPFPGMDPYLQMQWRDVHTSLVTYTRDQLQRTLPSGPVARAEERVYLENDGEFDRSLYPDVFVVEKPRRATSGAIAVDEIELAEPFIVKFPNDPVTERFVEIRDAQSGNRVITIIEFISPTYKIPGPGYDLYKQKQKDTEKAGVTLVEVDLVLGGKRVLSVPLSRIKFKDRTRYQTIVRRGWQWHIAEVYPLPLHKRLPAIPIPLRQTDENARLDLQGLIDQCYVNGGHDDIDYQLESDPPLEGHEADWADKLLREAGKRK